MKKLLLSSLCFLLLSIAHVFAQTHAVTGTVTDKDGSPIPGVTVKIKGSSTGTQTNIAGYFSINTSADAVLSFSFIGYVTQEIPVTGKSAVNVTLAASSEQLVEVVVTGYQTKTRAANTGAISTVSPKEDS